MAEYLVELYVSRADPDAVRDGAARARAAAEELAREGTLVRFVRSLFVPEEETCFYLYEAASAADVRAAAQRAALPFDRIAQAIGDS
jgi:muconolactone delta-isomerase